jgi:energy-coupling factor transport system substrate-specific component
MSRTSSSGWRINEIVTAAVISVAFGVIFWAWGLLWAATGPAFAAFPPAQALMYGVWLMPAVLVPLMVRKPGAAVFAELIAATVSALLGSQWGVTVLLYGIAQGLAAEVVFAIAFYKVWSLRTALLAAAAAGVAAAVIDRVLYYPDWNAAWTSTYIVVVALSAAAIAGWGSTLLVRRLASAGALTGLAAGRTLA